MHSMSSATDSSSSTCSSDYERKRKLQKKLKKRKAEKKFKKHKKEKKKKNSHKVKKRSRRDTNSSEQESQFQKPIAPSRDMEVLSNNDAFGPALPAHLCNKIQIANTDCSPSDPIVIGPIIPAEFLENKDKSEHEMANILPHNSSNLESEEENLQSSYGPLPVTNEKEMTAAQIELEQRALELKMAAIDGINKTQSDQKVREEWMLELPQVGLKGGLAALNNMKRGFHQGKEKPDFSDRTSWTKTPQTENENQKATTSKISKEELEKQAHALYEKQRDDEQEALAKKHKKKHKREESLVEIHQKKLRKEEKKRVKELKESGSKPERRPFTRDVDLKLNKIDSNQTKQIVDKAKILNTKFSSGHSKYL